MRMRPQPRRTRISGSGVMQYVLCPKCGDPVAGRLTAELTCVHCKKRFPFDKSEVRTGIVLFDEAKNGWIVS